MRAGAEIKANRWFGLFWSGVVLLACGGRTLEDGVYGFDGTSSTSSCSYAGKTYADGSLIAGACVCFCSNGRIECEQGCSTPSGRAPSGGASTGGAPSGGYGAVSSGGASSGGTSSGGYGAVTSGGAPSAGSPSGGASTAGVGGSFGGAAGSSSAGGSSAAGVGGAVSTCGPAPRASGAQPRIDDMEDGNSRILPFDNRSGVWYTYNDGTQGAYQFPQGQPFIMSAIGKDASGGAIVANTYGKGFASWGAGMGFVFNDGCPYDASIENGLHFFARSEYGPVGLYVLFATSATTPTTNNGTCVATTSTSCYDDYQTLIEIGSDWSEVFVSYGLLTQQGWGNRVKFDPRTLMGINFQTLYGNGSSFSFSIDSISFY